MGAELPRAAADAIAKVIFSDQRVERILLYGSRAKGTNRPNSDIDLCLDAPGLDLSGLLALENRLDDLLLPWKIDLSLLQKIYNADLIRHIGRVGKPWGKQRT